MNFFSLFKARKSKKCAEFVKRRKSMATKTARTEPVFIDTRGYRSGAVKQGWVDYTKEVAYEQS